jgi:hypothetical protein
MAKYNVNFDNHIEVPEILSVEGLFDNLEEATDKSDAKQEKSAKPEAIKSASAR